MTTIKGIKIALAISESGQIRVALHGDSTCYVHEKKIYDEFVKKIREDHQLWSLKIIETDINFPASYEKQ